ncbi:MAG: Leucine-tRNA ligase [Candidatus Falkowbacteria bacterium GW2011_GWF2_39_8]|uniref:leucine--tRNA ligase n=1 Tax=Candidatus Falkowbacteria bacterium GW2011_GWF2_39_8 TaxID=1618642 RepID=A0A0G0PYK5_9BACT|nr:MAG: Leucine-tRNA ligase [Candidatus Falkowbacteria bacterium GW2011_GWF2_39_8]
MSKYDFKIIEPKWQKKWEEQELYKAEDNSPKPKKYILDMFPYPSGSGLHVGHVESYTATDIYSRFMRLKGYNVLHPQGWDAFGLPAENYAIKTGIHPTETTKEAIKTFTKQINSLGFSYDWSREVNSSDPAYYKWTQWLFLLFYKNGLAYKKKAKVNWCESCQTVLANEQAEGGVCDRCGNKVIQKDLEQWFFKITDFIEDQVVDNNEVKFPRIFLFVFI